jgi:hypothetical protein
MVVSVCLLGRSWTVHAKSEKLRPSWDTLVFNSSSHRLTFKLSQDEPFGGEREQISTLHAAIAGFISGTIQININFSENSCREPQNYNIPSNNSSPTVTPNKLFKLTNLNLFTQYTTTIKQVQVSYSLAPNLRPLWHESEGWWSRGATIMTQLLNFF